MVRPSAVASALRSPPAFSFVDQGLRLGLGQFGLLGGDPILRSPGPSTWSSGFTTGSVTPVTWATA